VTVAQPRLESALASAHRAHSAIPGLDRTAKAIPRDVTRTLVVSDDVQITFARSTSPTVTEARKCSESPTAMSTRPGVTIGPDIGLSSPGEKTTVVKRNERRTFVTLVRPRLVESPCAEKAVAIRCRSATAVLVFLPASQTPLSVAP
jgi:hypothetical protein